MKRLILRLRILKIKFAVSGTKAPNMFCASIELYRWKTGRIIPLHNVVMYFTRHGSFYNLSSCSSRFSNHYQFFENFAQVENGNLMDLGHGWANWLVWKV